MDEAAFAPTRAESARDVVASHIARRAKRFPDLSPDPLSTAGLDARDAALASAIDHAVSRHWLTLAHLVQSRLDRPWERVQPELQAIFLVGAAQLFFLDRLPDHAIVNHAVEWAKRNVRAKAGGFVNAVMRSLVELRGDDDPAPTGSGPITDLPEADVLPLSDGRLRRLREAVFGSEVAERMAQQTSHGHWLVRRWIERFGPGRATTLCLHDLVHAPILVSKVGDPPPRWQADLAPHTSQGAFVFTGSHEALLEFLRASPDVRVQDPTSAFAATLANDLEPRVIADVCAGRGTKTRQLRQEHPNATIIASDIDARRLAGLREQFADDELVLVAEKADFLEHAGRCDLLVLDVPCSNTGVLARRVEAKYRFSEERLKELVSIQRQIVADSLALLAPGGAILYCTCSIEAEENEEQAAWIEKWHRHRRVAERLTLPAGLPGDPPSVYHDGGYAALLQ